jgi:hypothetical protein
MQSQKKYNRGDIIVWLGYNPCVGRLDRDIDVSKARCHVEECIRLDSTHSSLHFKNVRLATQIEMQKLGDNDKYLFLLNPNTKKIKITGCNDSTQWYNDNIGSEFEVYDREVDFVVAKHYNDSRLDRDPILKSDCVTV